MRDKWSARRARRTLAGIVVASMALASVAGLTPPSRTVAQATMPTPTVTAFPNTNVSDVQFLVITFKGFGASQAFDFRQCIPSPVAIVTDCTGLLAINGSVITGVADKKGTGSAYVPVFAGADNALMNAGGTGPITCDDRHSCVVALMADPNDLSTANFVAITFAPPANLCPPPGSNVVVGSGSASAARAMYQWQAAVCQAPTSLPVRYAPTDSPSGVTSFMAGTTQFGVTGPWAPAYAPASLGTPPRTWAYAPITMSGVVLAYRMYDNRGQQITSLTLTPTEIAQIFTGSLNNLATDPGVAALNPGIQFPSVLSTYVRAEHAADSLVFSTWLAAMTPSIWKFGPEEIFPANSGVIAKTGSNGVATSVLINPTGVFKGSGTIGYMDSSTAAYYGLPTVKIANADGTVTPATAATIENAVGRATVNGDGTVTPGTPDDSAWPMLMPTYMMVPTNNVTPTAGKEVADFLRYAVQAGQNSTTLPAGYAPLTVAMALASVHAAGAIPVTAPTASPPPLLAVSSSTSSSFGASNPGFVPPLVAPAIAPARPAASPAATAGAPAPVTTVPALALTSESTPLLPVSAGLAVLALLAGLGLEVSHRVSRRRSRSPRAGEL